MSQDNLLSGLKWRCKICMMTMSLIDHGDADLSAMEQHVKRHRGLMAGMNDPETKNMNWKKYIESVGKEGNIAS